MNEEEQAKAAARLHGVPYASFDNNILRMRKEDRLEYLVPKSFAKEELVLPLFIDRGVLSLAMADPGNAALIATISRLAGKPVQPFIATKTQLIAAIELYYGR